MTPGRDRGLVKVRLNPESSICEAELKEASFMISELRAGYSSDVIL
jgi:hypothetical protein